MVAGHVRMEIEALGHLRRGDAVGAVLHVEVDLTSGGIPEGRRDGRHRRRKLVVGERRVRMRRVLVHASPLRRFAGGRWADRLAPRMAL